jgi:hypothetical protein
MTNLATLIFALATTLAPTPEPVTAFGFCKAMLMVVETDSEAELFDQLCLTDVADDTADGSEE